MCANRCASLNPDIGSKFHDFQRVAIGDGILLWYNQIGISALGIAENTFVESPELDTVPVIGKSRGAKAGVTCGHQCLLTRWTT
jgi:hypothetical protein